MTTSEDFNELLNTINKALRMIEFAKLCKDGRKRNKQIRDAKVKAQEIVWPLANRIRTYCEHQNLLGRDDLFTIGFLESDLEIVKQLLLEARDYQ